MEERCTKYPSIPKSQCSHCEGISFGTEEHPIFSIQDGFDQIHGYPVVEILKNGGPVHRFDSHFRFGRRKAEMVLACLDIIHDFANSTDEERLLFQSKVIEDRRRNLSVHIYVEMQPDFEHSSGIVIDRPWLQLKALTPDTDHLGLGVMKCRAISAVRDELRKWVEKQYSS